MQGQMEAQHYLQNIYQLLSKQQNNIHIQKEITSSTSATSNAKKSQFTFIPK